MPAWSILPRSPLDLPWRWSEHIDRSVSLRPSLPPPHDHHQRSIWNWRRSICT